MTGGVDMRAAWGIIIALGLSFPAAGLTSQQQDAPPAATEPSMERRAPSPVHEPPQAEPKKKADAGAASANARRRGAGKRVSEHTPPGTPRKVVVREGGAAEPKAQIVAGLAPEEASRQRLAAEQWLNSTDETLRRLAPRTISAQQQETVSQIQNYMEGARSALNEGDIARAHTLALKASLLADDLAKH